MIMTEGLARNASSLVRKIIGGGKPRRREYVDNSKTFNVPQSAVALFQK